MKERLDVMMVNRGLAESREKAKAIIMSGIVYVDNIKEDKAGSTFDEKARIEVRGNTLKYVSRGGLKLEKAMDCFGVSLAGKVAGCRIFNRWIYRLYAAKWCGQGVLGGCRTRTACMEASK